MSLYGCTIGVILPEASSNGRPLVFKTRDISRSDVQFNTYTPLDGYVYCANTYIGSDVAWLGVNEAGFGITQSDVMNFFSHDHSDNGTIISYALTNFSLVDEFEAYLDSTDYGDRNIIANYAVIDAEGNGAMFEVNNIDHIRYDPDTSGFITRTNFGFAGDTLNYYGIERMFRADSLIRLAKAGDSLDAKYISMYVMSDFKTPYQNPYPLPFLGSFAGSDYGWIDTRHDLSNERSIFNNRTVCSAVIESPALFEDNSLSVMYCGMDTPAISVPFVMFPSAHLPPPYVSGSSPAYLNLARNFHFDVFHDPLYSDLLDSHILLDSAEIGIWNYVRPASEAIFAWTNSKITLWNSDSYIPSNLINFQDSVANLAYNVMASGSYDLCVNELDSKNPHIECLTASPNPFTDIIAVMHESSSIQIFDIKGNQINDGVKIRRNGGILWRPSEDIPGGIYLASIIKENGENQTIRFVYLK